MSDEIQQPLTRMSRRARREQQMLPPDGDSTAPFDAVGAAPPDEISTQPTPVAVTPVAIPPAAAAPVTVAPAVSPAYPVTVTPIPAEPQPISAPVSRVERRSASLMFANAPQAQPQPPTPPVYGVPSVQPGATITPVPSVAPVATPAPMVAAPPVTAAPLPGVPPWHAITTGSVPTGETKVVQDPRQVASAASGRIPPPSAGYTWLQYLILLIVAFVLGLLLWQLIIGEIQLPHHNTPVVGTWPGSYLILEELPS